MFCSKCGTELLRDSKFCPSCGDATSQNRPQPEVSDKKVSKGSGNLSKSEIFGGVLIGIIAIIFLAYNDIGNSSPSVENKQASVATPAESTPPPTSNIPRLSPQNSQNVPADTIGLRVKTLEDMSFTEGCSIHSEAFNNTSVVVQTLHFEVQLYDASGLALETESWWYSNVRPGKSVAFEMGNVENVPCNDIDRAVVTAMRCVAGGTSYSAGACAEFLSFTDGLLDWKLNGQ